LALRLLSLFPSAGDCEVSQVADIRLIFPLRKDAPMIAPANFLRQIPATPAKSKASIPATQDLLPWADPYIAQLVAQHEAELAAEHAARPTASVNRIVKVRRPALVAA
jgi:hypothetical protein